MFGLLMVVAALRFEFVGFVWIGVFLCCGFQIWGLCLRLVDWLLVIMLFCLRGLLFWIGCFLGGCCFGLRLLSCGLGAIAVASVLVFGFRGCLLIVLDSVVLCAYLPVLDLC